MRRSGCLRRARTGRCARSVPRDAELAVASTRCRPPPLRARFAASSCALSTVRFDGDVHRRAADEQRARARAAEPGAAIGVALHDADLVDRHAEHVDGELRVRRRAALPHRLRRRERSRSRRRRSRSPSRAPRTRRRRSIRGTSRCRARATRPRALRLRGARVEPVPVGVRERPVHHVLELADVVGLAPSGSCTASARAGSCCAGEARCGRCRSCAPRRPSAARSCRSPRAAPRRDTARSASCS